jgi:hypothetical protein
VDRVERDVVGMDPAGHACLTRGLLDGEDATVEARVARVARRDPVELFARSLLDQLDPAATRRNRVLSSGSTTSRLARGVFLGSEALLQP